MSAKLSITSGIWIFFISAALFSAEENQEIRVKKNTLGTLNYVMESGEEKIFDAEGNEKATIFYVAYFKEGKDPDRPITLCFNGGPGSSAIWLHMGAFGPKKVVIDESGNNSPPHVFVDNENSILKYTDLVFVDPISTGYSRVKKGEDPKQFYNVDEDIKQMSEFIRQFITKKERWNSPKYLAGESYGAARVIGIADFLDEKARLNFNGLILISAATNLSWIRPGQVGCDLPYVLFLPSYTATAFYHKKLGNGFKNLDESIAAAKAFASGPYLTALMKGDLIKQEEKKEIAIKLSALTGLSADWILSSNIRIPPMRFGKELLKKEGLVIGRFDSRLTGDTIDVFGSSIEYDPSQEAIFPSFAAAFHQYMNEELGVSKIEEYKFLTSLQPWNFCRNSQEPMNMGNELRELLIKNKNFHVFFAMGIYDLATPFFSQEYLADHLGLNEKQKNNLAVHFYPAGHMMYVDQASMKMLSHDLLQFFQNSEKKHSGNGSQK